MSNTTLDTLYLVDQSDLEVTLSVTIGGANQTSLMTIKMDDEVLVQNHSGDLNKTLLGANKNLHGKKLRIVATITDTSRDTNYTSLGIVLGGGLIGITFPLLKTVEKEGQSVNYLCLIEFFSPGH